MNAPVTITILGYDEAIATARKHLTEAVVLQRFLDRHVWTGPQLIDEREIIWSLERARESLAEASDIQRRSMAHAIGVRAVEEAVS